MHFQLIQKDRNSTTLQELPFLLIAKKKTENKNKKTTNKSHPNPQELGHFLASYLDY